MDYIYIVHGVATSWTQLSDFHIFLVFPDSSVGKESACNVGDSSLIPGSGRSAGERIGFPLQYSWVQLCGTKAISYSYIYIHPFPLESPSNSPSHPLGHQERSQAKDPVSHGQIPDSQKPGIINVCQSTRFVAISYTMIDNFYIEEPELKQTNQRTIWKQIIE